MFRIGSSGMETSKKRIARARRKPGTGEGRGRQCGCAIPPLEEQPGAGVGCDLNHRGNVSPPGKSILFPARKKVRKRRVAMLAKREIAGLYSHIGQKTDS
jgi:hypothetical protein